jgi:hypothetical protein
MYGFATVYIPVCLRRFVRDRSTRIEESEREMKVNLEGSCLSHGFSDLQ